MYKLAITDQHCTSQHFCRLIAGTRALFVKAEVLVFFSLVFSGPISEEYARHWNVDGLYSAFRRTNFWHIAEASRKDLYVLSAHLRKLYPDGLDGS